MATSTTGLSYQAWKKKNPNGTISQWKVAPAVQSNTTVNSKATPRQSVPNKSLAPVQAISAQKTPNLSSKVPAQTGYNNLSKKSGLNFTLFSNDFEKQNPGATQAQIQSEFNKQAGAGDYMEKKVAQNQQTAKNNQQIAQDAYVKSGGQLAPGQVYDPYAYLQKNAQLKAAGQEVTDPTIATISQNDADLIRSNIGGVADYKTPLDQQTHFGQAQDTPLDQMVGNTPESVPLQDFATQLQEQQDQVSQLVNSLNQKQVGLGDTVNGVLQDMAKNGVQAQLTPETFKMIQGIASETPPDQLDDKISQMAPSQQSPEPPIVQQEMTQPNIQAPFVPPPKQQYKELQKSGMNAGQIVQQDPKLMSQVVPDGSILNPGAGVGIVQTPLGDAYKTPSGLVIPKDPSTGFYNLSALTPDQITKMSFADLMSIDLATQKTTSDMKAFYSAQTFQQMAARNDREYGIAQVDLESFYNSENNRLNESQVKAMQDIELEKMRQDLSKSTAIQDLNSSKSKAANIMKAQMDAWGLEGSSVMVMGMVAQSSKFEQEISKVTQSYDINIMQLSMASTQTQMEFTNRVTELNQKMQVQKMSLTSEYLGKKDEISNSMLLSKIEQTTEQQNMYRDYVSKIYDNEQQQQAAMAEAEKEAKAETWEKQKYYTEQMGFLVEVGSDGMPVPLVGEDGNPVTTLTGKKSDLEVAQFEWDQAKYSADYDLRVQEFQNDQYEFGIDAEFRERQFNQNVQEFGMNYALQQDKQLFDQNMAEQGLNLDLMEYNQNDEQFYAKLNSFESIEFDENTGTYMGKTATGMVDLGADYGKMGVAVPNKSAYEFNVLGPNEVRFNLKLGEPDPVSTGKQCGSFVNYALWGEASHFGNSIEADIQKYSNSSVPVAGGAFMERIGGDPGHKGLIEKVNKDGQGNIISIEIIEQNWKKNAQGDGVVSRATIVPGSDRWNRMFDAGFYDPSMDGTSKKNVPEKSSLNKLPPAEEQKLRKQISASNEAKSITAFNDLQKSLQNYYNLVDKAGAVAMNESNQAEITNAYANLKVKWKEAANLGALTGPDLGLLEDAIPNITSYGAIFNKLRPGDSKLSILNAIKSESNRIQSEAETRKSTLINTYPDMAESELIKNYNSLGVNPFTNGSQNQQQNLTAGVKKTSPSSRYSLPGQTNPTVQYAGNY